MFSDKLATIAKSEQILLRNIELYIVKSVVSTNMKFLPNMISITL